MFDLHQSSVRALLAEINLHPSRKSEIELRLLNLGTEEVSCFLTACNRSGATCLVSRFYIQVEWICKHWPTFRYRSVPASGWQDFNSPTGTDVPNSTLKGDVRISIARAVTPLAPGYRSIFLLHDIHGLDHGEIASMLECTRGNTKSLLYKARRVLRGALTTQAGSDAGRSSRKSAQAAD
jgi:hypothetical protein